jgi:hypothetical protein
MTPGTPDDPRHDRETPHPVDPAELPRSTRLLLVGAGAVCLVLGAAGALLPILPTTPFVLLAGVCFARGSPAFHRALRESRLFGAVLRDWEEHRSISRGAKLKAVVLVLVVFTVSITWALETTPPRLVMGAVGLGVLAFLVRLPETPERDPERPR